MKININDVRLAFPVLFEPKAVQEGGEPAFSAGFLMTPNHKAVAAINAGIDAVGQEKWGKKWPDVFKEMQKKDKLCLHDGDDKKDYAGYEGNMFVSTRSKTRPLVIDRDKSPLQERDGRPYSGCYVNCSIELWAQDNQYGKRVNAQLRGVQFLRDGDPFSGAAPASAEEFDDLGMEDDSSGLV